MQGTYEMLYGIISTVAPLFLKIPGPDFKHRWCKFRSETNHIHLVSHNALFRLFGCTGGSGCVVARCDGIRAAHWKTSPPCESFDLRKRKGSNPKPTCCDAQCSVSTVQKHKIIHCVIDTRPAGVENHAKISNHILEKYLKSSKVSHLLLLDCLPFLSSAPLLQLL